MGQMLGIIMAGTEKERCKIFVSGYLSPGSGYCVQFWSHPKKERPEWEIGQGRLNEDDQRSQVASGKIITVYVFAKDRT